MPAFSNSFLFRRISSLLALAIIVFLATLVGAYCIHQSAKLKELKKPLIFDSSFADF